MTRVLLCFLALAAISCSGSETPAPSEQSAAAPAPNAPVAPNAPNAPVAPVAPSLAPEASIATAGKPVAPKIVVLGDSLTAGLGIPQDRAYPALLQQKVKAAGHGFEVINAGVSGDTSADGLQRTNWALEGDVRLLILALGANDALRGLPARQMKDNLQGIIHRARQRGIPVLLVGMEAPPNYGEQYAAAFRQVFQDLSRENKIPLVPFLLEGVAGAVDLNQADGIHPTAAGARRIADHLWPAVEKMIEPTK